MKCFSCVIFPVILAGILGTLTGNVATALGLSHSTAYTWAGFMGYMGGSFSQYVTLIFSHRYSKPSKSVKVNI